MSHISHLEKSHAEVILERLKSQTEKTIAEEQAECSGTQNRKEQHKTESLNPIQRQQNLHCGKRFTGYYMQLYGP